MSDNQLQQIQALQFQARPAAEALLLDFVRAVFPDLEVTGVQLRPLAVSLNSFNGFLTQANGTKLFFKTHVEPGSVVSEYYNSKLLADADYPIIQPKFASTDYGKQFLIYDVIDAPSVFDAARAIEYGTPFPGIDLAALTKAQHAADDRLLEIYLATLQPQSAQDAEHVPVQQLFFHRLADERYRQFYAGKPFTLPGKITLSWEELCRQRWIINGLEYDETLAEGTARALDLLRPAQPGPSIIGHGDAHNGNVFFTSDSLYFFDPAFGGRHHPLLDLAKPLFHNVFATWMYHPDEIAETLHIELRQNDDRLLITHDYTPSPCREMFFQSKLNRLLRPFVQRASIDWNERAQAMLKAALMCCPLLTMNLADRGRFRPEIALLGLCYVVETGLHSKNANRPDQFNFGTMM